MNVYNKFVLTLSGQICRYLNPLCSILAANRTVVV